MCLSIDGQELQDRQNIWVGRGCGPMSGLLIKLFCKDGHFATSYS